MKMFIATLSLLALMTAQAASLSPKVLVGLDSRMENQKAELEAKVNAANTDDITEGKIVASINQLVLAKIALAQDMLNSLSDDGITEENIALVTAVLDEADKLISEI